MPIDLRAYTPYFKKLYLDRMDITSTVEGEDSDGATVNSYPKEPQQVDIPCRISLSGKDVPRELGEPFAQVKTNPVIFCPPDVEVKAGDKVTVRRCHSDGTVYETYQGLLAVTGRPNNWVTHQEFELRLEGDA